MAQTESERKEYFRVIQSKIHQLNELSKQLSLSYETSESVPIHLELVNCQKWSQSFLHAVSMECYTKGIKIETVADSPSFNLNYVNADSYQLERALQTPPLPLRRLERKLENGKRLAQSKSPSWHESQTPPPLL